MHHVAKLDETGAPTPAQYEPQRFANLGDQPVRWFETQAPLPPAKEVCYFLTTGR